MKKLPKYISIVIVTALFIVVTIFGYLVTEFYIKQPEAKAIAVSFIIERGDTVKKISQELEYEGIIDDQFMFRLYVWLLGLEKNFQAGSYEFKKGTSISKLVGAMTTINVRENSFTIIEGWNLRELAEYLKNKGLIKEDNELYYLTGRPAIDYRKNLLDFQAGWDYEFLADKPPYVGLEGYIYPDTYRILDESDVKNLISKALDNFDKKLTPELRKEIKRQGFTIFEVVTMASIVEKEANTYEDRRIVADIMRRRLKLGMALQMDSTVNYITASGRTRSTYEDLEINSPWNTYKYKGLPLGPINNPSILAIKAVVYPTPNSYLYFLSDKEGNMYYARTGAEHARNRKYLD